MLGAGGRYVVHWWWTKGAGAVDGGRRLRGQALARGGMDRQEDWSQSLADGASWLAGQLLQCGPPGGKATTLSSISSLHPPVFMSTRSTSPNLSNSFSISRSRASYSKLPQNTCVGVGVGVSVGAKSTTNIKGGAYRSIRLLRHCCGSVFTSCCLLARITTGAPKTTGQARRRGEFQIRPI